jgi:tetratricopeptide (TPR) repeat protein
MRQRLVPNDQLRSLLDETGWSGQKLAQVINQLGTEAGLTLTYQRASVTQWLSGIRPRPPVPELMVEAFSRQLGRPVTMAETGLGSVTRAPRRSEPLDWWKQSAATVLLEACALRGPMAHEARPYRLAELAVPAWSDMVSLCLEPRSPASTTAKATRTDVESAATMLHVFSDIDMMFGGGHARHALASYLQSTIAPWLAGDASPAVRRELLTTAARLTYLYGFMCFDDELHGTAQHHYLASLRLSAEGGDALGYAVTLRALSVQARLLGHRRPAVHLAESAVRIASNRVPARIRAFVLGQLAVAYAAAGNRHDALTTLFAAERNLSNADECSTGVAAYNFASLAHQQAATVACLGDRRNAIRALEVSIRHRPANERRSRAITLARLAELHLIDGHIGHACHTWQQFLDDYPFIRSGRADTALKTLRASIRPYQNYPTVRALLRRAATLRAAAGNYPTPAPAGSARWLAAPFLAALDVAVDDPLARPAPTTTPS